MSSIDATLTVDENFDVPIEGVTATTPSIDGVAKNDTQNNANKPAIWRARIARARRYKRQLIQDWRFNIDFRRGKVYASDTDEDRSVITWDWSATKAKHAQLFSQIPRVRLKARKPKYQQGVAVFGRRLNAEMEKADIAAAMNEVMPDVINAAGFGLVMVHYESRVEQRDISQVPAVSTDAGGGQGMDQGNADNSGSFASPAPIAPTSALAPAPPTGNLGPVPISPVAQGPVAPGPQAPMPPDTQTGQPMVGAGKPNLLPYTTDRRLYIERLSPSDALWDMTFQGSNFNRCPWIGRSGRMHFSRALGILGVKPEDRPHVCSTGIKPSYDRLTSDEDRDRYIEAEMVEFDECFYWRYLFHDDEPSFTAIQRLVFVKGLDQPTINEPWKGQKRLNEVTGQEDPQGTIIAGSQLPPIQFLTLTYMSDEPIPPSDTAMGRPAVEELMQARTDQMLQRRQSRPIRWFNNNLVAPEMVTQLMRGTWQGLIPMNGPGDRALGEIARSAYPPDDYNFDKVFKSDLMESWSLNSQGVGVSGNVGVRTAAEANNAQGNMQQRIGFERALANKFYCNIAEVCAGLWTLYGKWDDDETQAMQGLDLTHLPTYYTYSTRVDSSVVMEAGQRIKQIEEFVNMTAKSGLVNELEPLQEYAALMDFDEAIVAQPKPKGPEPANVSVRISGAADLEDPLMVALLVSTGQLTEDGIKKAQQLIIESKNAMNTIPGQPGGVPGMGQMPMLPPGPQGLPPGPQPAEPVDANPHWDMAGRVNKRMQDGR